MVPLHRPAKSSDSAVYKNIQALERDIHAWARTWNENPKPIIWNKAADNILTSIARLIK
jgi:hypothetical protein